MKNRMQVTELPIEDQPSRLDSYGPVFITGCPRSGTTFLSNCVAALDGVEEFVGVIAPPRLMHLIAKTEGESQQELLHCVRDIFWQSFWRRILFRHERLDQALKRNIAWRDLMNRATFQGALFCYKEPFLAFAADELAQYFPTARFIHIIRDGRDNADSMVRTYPDALTNAVLKNDELTFNKISEGGFWRKVDGLNVPWWITPEKEELFLSEDPYGRYLMLWNEMVTRARKVAQRNPKNYHEVRYEALVQNPMQEAEKIATFLGKNINKLTTRKLRKASTRSIGIYQQNQPPELRQRAETIAGPLLRELGYLG